jgi:hypothetical protein
MRDGPPKQDHEDEIADLRTELHHLLPMVAAACHCFDHGWLSAEAAQFWCDKVNVLLDRLRALTGRPAPFTTDDIRSWAHARYPYRPR